MLRHIPPRVFLGSIHPLLYAPPAGATNRMPLCLCSNLYQCTNSLAHSYALSQTVPKEIFGRYFRLLNRNSEYALSLLTGGRLKEGAISSQWSVASSVAPFTGPPPTTILTYREREQKQCRAGSHTEDRIVPWSSAKHRRDGCHPHDQQPHKQQKQIAVINKISRYPTRLRKQRLLWGGVHVRQEA